MTNFPPIHTKAYKRQTKLDNHVQTKVLLDRINGMLYMHSGHREQTHLMNPLNLNDFESRHECKSAARYKNSHNMSAENSTSDLSLLFRIKISSKSLLLKDTE